MKDRALDQKACGRRIPSPQEVQGQEAAQKPPMGFDPPAFPGSPLNVQGHVAPRSWAESGSYLFKLSIPWVTTLARAGQHHLRAGQMCQDQDTIYRAQCKMTT